MAEQAHAAAEKASQRSTESGSTEALEGELAGSPITGPIHEARGRLTPKTVLWLQRTVGNQATVQLLSRAAARQPVMKAPPAAPEVEAIPGDAPASQGAVQRQIVGSTGRNIWAEEIAARLQTEQDGEVREAANRLHSMSGPIFVGSYQELVSKIKAGKYEVELSQSKTESPNEVKYDAPSDTTIPAVSELLGGLTRNYGAALSSHPLTASVWNSGDKNWQTPGIREVLNMFLFLYANADTVETYFSQHPQSLTKATLETLDKFLLSQLGALVLNAFIDPLTTGGRKFGEVLKEGLDVVENKLRGYGTDQQAINDYVTDNLSVNIESKEYTRKITSARQEPQKRQDLSTKIVERVLTYIQEQEKSEYKKTGKKAVDKSTLVMLVGYGLQEQGQLKDGADGLQQVKAMVTQITASLGSLIGDEAIPNESEVEALYNKWFG